MIRTDRDQRPTPNPALETDQNARSAQSLGGGEPTARDKAQVRGVLVTLLVVLCCAGCDRADTPDLVLRNVRVIEGTGAPPTSPVAVAIRDGRIISIGEGADTLAGATESIDLEGRFLVPGFIDLHVHLPPDSAIQDEILQQFAEYGVTTILNPGAREGAGVQLRNRLSDRLPRMLTAGPIIEHASADGEVAEWARLVSTEAEAREEVRRQASSGVDFVKFYSGLPPDVVAALVDEATAAGIPVIGHTGATTWLEAVQAGTSMLVHSGWGTPMDEIVNLPDPAAASDAEWYAAYADAPNGVAFHELTAAIVEHNVFVVPTLSIHQAAGLGKDNSLLPLFETDLAPEADLEGWWTEGWRERHPQYGEVSEEEDILMNEVYWPGVLGIVRAMYERGVTLGVGTDVGNSWITPGVSFHYEMALYSDAGIPALDILTMATRNGAAALGLTDSIGTVEVGKRADLVVLASDPTLDIGATRDIEMVLIGGAIVVPGR